MIKAPEGLTDLFGHCQSFCIRDTQPSGASVEAHGDRCIGTARLVTGDCKDGSQFTLIAEVVAPYRHRRYSSDDFVPLGRDRTIQLGIVANGVQGDPAWNDMEYLQLALGDARRPARFLDYRADVADRAMRAGNWQLNGATVTQPHPRSLPTWPGQGDQICRPLPDHPAARRGARNLRAQISALVKRGETTRDQAGGRGQWRIERSKLGEFIEQAYESTERDLQRRRDAGEDLGEGALGNLLG